MYFEITSLISLTIVFPLAVALFYWRKTDSQYVPFFLLVLLSFINESASYVLIKNNFSTYLNTNIYALVRSVLIIWQFRKWSNISRNVMLALQLLLLVSWIFETIQNRSNIQVYYSFGMILAACIILVLCIEQVARLIIKPIFFLRSPVFLICIGWILFYVFHLITEVLWVIKITQKQTFYSDVNVLLLFGILMSHVFYIKAIVWMPLNRKYILGY